MATGDRSRTNSEDTTIERVAASTPPPSPMFEPPAAPPLEPDAPISTLMSTPVAWVEPTASLIEVAATLETEGVGAAAVLSGDHLYGVVSERDVVQPRCPR